MILRRRPPFTEGLEAPFSPVFWYLAELDLSPSTDDHEAIRRTLALYAQMLDSKDAAGWSEQFAANGTLHTAAGDVAGRPAIKRHSEQQLASEAPGRNTAPLV